MNAIVEKPSFDLTPKSLDEAMKFAELLADSTIVPKDFIGKPGNILVAIQWGMELGLKPLQAMQNIAVINGRPSLWGDAVIALVRASPLCEYVYENTENGTAICRVKRRGEEEQIRTFSNEDASKAGLSGKAGTWTQYPERMKQMRARAFALRDVFPDVLKGMPIAEEVMDIPSPQPSPAQIAAQARPSSQRVEHHDHMIDDLEFVAKEHGHEKLAQCWSGKSPLRNGLTLTTEDRKAIGTEELKRLKALVSTRSTNDLLSGIEP